MVPLAHRLNQRRTTTANFRKEIHMSQFHDLQMTDIHGDSVPFDRFRGTSCLIVNVASA